jgi:alpha-beta hydrolase superfamily lysophospholipase
MSLTTTSTSTDREARQVEQANASGRTPVVFIHGLWLLPSSWDHWADLFEEEGYAAVTPSWPDDPETVAEARAHPEVFAKKTLGQVADHTAEVIGGLEKKPAVMGHSTGGLLAQIIADRVYPRRRWRSIRDRFAVCCRCQSQRCGPRDRCSGTP